MTNSASLPGVTCGRNGADHTLQPTGLVHEAYLRLINQQRVDWRNRAQFFGLAASMMRAYSGEPRRIKAGRKSAAANLKRHRSMKWRWSSITMSWI